MEFTVKQAAARLKVTPARVCQLIKLLEIKPEIGSCYRGYRFLLSAEHIAMMRQRNKKGGRVAKSNGAKNG